MMAIQEITVITPEIITGITVITLITPITEITTTAWITVTEAIIPITEITTIAWITVTEAITPITEIIITAVPAEILVLFQNPTKRSPSLHREGAAGSRRKIHPQKVSQHPQNHHLQRVHHLAEDNRVEATSVAFSFFRRRDSWLWFIEIMK